MVRDTLAVRENFDDDDDDEDDPSDDVDDEVFVRDGGKMKKIPKTEKLRRDERPLMPVRRKSKPSQTPNVASSPDVCNRQPCNIYNCLLPVYFALATIISIAFFMLLYVFLVDKLPLAVGKFHFWSTTPPDGRFHTVVAPCSNPRLENIWSKRIPELTSNTQITLIDVDRDNVSDVVIGIGAESADVRPPEPGCEFDFEESEMPCSGGVFAFNGKNGSIMWHRWLPKVVLAVHCDFEITGDAIPDCVVTGKDGLFAAINGVDGSVIWNFNRKPGTIFELYSVLITRDINQDNYLDIIAGRYAKSKGDIESSEIFAINGRDGNIFEESSVSLYEPILHAPQILTGIDGRENVCFVTGHSDREGGVYIIPLADLIRGDSKKITALYQFNSGILAAPVYADLNLDETHDIIFINGQNVFAIDGKNYLQLWNTSLYDYVAGVHRIFATSSVTPGYFNEDRIPDVLVTVSVGSDFPEFYYSMLLILDGKTGESLLGEPVIRSSIADTEGSITLSFSGTGNDAFVYWSAACTNYIESKNTFTFAEKNKNQFLAELCSLRFNSTTQLKLYALNRHIEPPGVPLLKVDESNGVTETDNQRKKTSHNSQLGSIRNDYNPDVMMPKVAASGVITQPISTKDDVDIILTYQEVKADADVCIIMDSEEKCMPNKQSSINQLRENGRTREDGKDNTIFGEHVRYEHRKKLEKYSTSSNLFISRHHLTCECNFLRKEDAEKCSIILPLEEQSFPSYRGHYGNWAFKARTTFFS